MGALVINNCFHFSALWPEVEQLTEHGLCALAMTPAHACVAPAGGRSLFLSLHGGGGAPAEVNDSQWRNQIALAQGYRPQEGLYVAPRAPTNSWKLWHEDHLDALFDRLIADLVVLENVNPNRVYVLGYSAGGDGVYQLGPRMADRWAAASMP